MGILGRRARLPKRLVDQLRARFKELGLPKSDFEVLRGEDAILKRDRKAPFVLVFFGHKGFGATYDGVLSNVMADSVPAFPVVADLKQFKQQIPQALRDVNGIAMDDADDAARLAGLVLEAFRLLRSTRRLFISYRRVESQTIAMQLYEELDSRTYDVFLDTHSVKPGEEFQKLLWHRLADTDVLLLLESPNVRDSQWTMDELAQANATSIQVLQIAWPGVQHRLEAAFSEKVRLKPEDFRTKRVIGSTARLKSAVLRSICNRVESLRARALSARYTYIVDRFCDDAQALGLTTVVQQGRLIDVRLPTKSLVVIPAVGVPTAELTERIEKTVLASQHAGSDVWIVYDERGIMDLWVEHLAWLNGYVAAKTVQIAECEDQLRAAAR